MNVQDSKSNTVQCDTVQYLSAVVMVWNRPAMMNQLMG